MLLTLSCVKHVLLFCHYFSSINIMSAINTQRCWTLKGKKEDGHKNPSTHAEFSHTTRLSDLPWGSPVRSSGIQTAVQLLPLHLNIEAVLLSKELPRPSKSLEIIIRSLQSPGAQTAGMLKQILLPFGCWLFRNTLAKLKLYKTNRKLSNEDCNILYLIS